MLYFVTFLKNEIFAYINNNMIIAKSIFQKFLEIEII